LTRQQVKERLPYGAGKTLAQRTGRHPAHVSQVLAGKRPDRKVAVAVARMLGTSLADLPAEFYAG
jgi:hypothetical protein